MSLLHYDSHSLNDHLLFAIQGISASYMAHDIHGMKQIRVTE